jgi:hypothetical protein
MGDTGINGRIFPVETVFRLHHRRNLWIIPLPSRLCDLAFLFLGSGTTTDGRPGVLGPQTPFLTPSWRFSAFRRPSPEGSGSSAAGSGSSPAGGRSSAVGGDWPTAVRRRTAEGGRSSTACGRSPTAGGDSPAATASSPAAADTPASRSTGRFTWRRSGKPVYRRTRPSRSAAKPPPRSGPPIAAQISAFGRFGVSLVVSLRSTVCPWRIPCPNQRCYPSPWLGIAISAPRIADSASRLPGRRTRSRSASMKR